MRRVGHVFMALGAVVGLLVALAIAGQQGVAGVPWLINVALAKLGVVAALALLAVGAVLVRQARRRVAGGAADQTSRADSGPAV